MTHPLPSPRLRLPRLLGLVAALCAASCSLPVSSHAPWPGDGAGLPGAPLPDGWPGARPPAAAQGVRDPAPLWGLGPVAAPSAGDCRGPQRLREVPGGWQGRAPAGAAAATLADTARRERSAEPARDGALAKTVRPLSPAAPPVAATAGARPDALDERDARAAPPPAERAQAVPQAQPAPHETVTAGMVDDNADFGEYLAFRQRSRHLGTRDRDVSERYRVEVRDGAGRPAADAEVALSWPGAPRALRFARTDAGGHVWLHPRALLAPWELARLPRLEVQVRSGDDVARTVLQRGQKAAVQLTLAGAAPPPARQPLDLVFMVDATGSMGDEIAKLRASLQTIADRVGALPAHPDLCWGLVAYRDRGDAFITRTHDLTDDLGAFQRHLSRLQAGGGGDYPESLNEALHESVHGISWRGDGTARLVVMIGDAPPHLDYGAPYYDQDAAAAVARGVKVHAVGASGLDAQGESVFRQIAQTTGGRFVFLTYRNARHPASGAGRETVHDVRDYSVDTLDELIVRLVRDELDASRR